MNSANPPGRRPGSDSGADSTNGCGGNGEGAGGALEAMLKKRQMRVSTEPDPAAVPVSQQQDGKPAGE
jgi:hypothetical protein